MKPPARKSCQSTRRMLVTRAVIDAASTSKRHLVADVEPQRCAGSPPRSTPRARRPAPARPTTRPAITFSLRLELRAVGDGELARQAAAPAHLLVALERRRRGPSRRRRGRAAPGSCCGGGASPFCASRKRGQRCRAGPAGCRSGTCPARRARPAPRSRAAGWPAATRTPRMKKVPRPTASRMTRVWLPGRAMCSTACRSANERAKRSGCTARTSATPARCSTNAVATKPPESIRPTLQRAGLPRGHADERRGDGRGHAPLQPVDAAGARHVVAQQQRRLDLPDLEQRHHREQQRHQQRRWPAPARPPTRSGRSRPAASRRRLPTKRRHRGDHGGGERDAEHAAGERRAAAPASCRPRARGARCRRGTSGWRCCAPSAARTRA